jgi:hypothetical protein
MRSADNSIQQCRVNDGYIDDIDNLADAPETNRAPECILRLTQSAQCWATLVLVAGHILGFHKGGYKDFEGDLVLANARGKKTKIKYIPPNKSNKSLGFLTNCLGDMTEEFNHRLHQAKELAIKTLPAKLSVQEANLALITPIIPAITYPFGVTSFSTQQLKRLAIATNNVFLPKFGINRKMVRVVVHGPLELGGINFPSFQVIQDYKGIDLLLRQLQLDQEISKDIKITLSHIQLQSGLITPILEDLSLDLPYTLSLDG